MMRNNSLMGTEIDSNLYWNPEYIEQSYNGWQHISVRGKNLTDGKIYLNGSICDETANSLLMQIEHLKSEGIPISMYINSRGGSVDAGLLIYDILQGIPKGQELNLYCTGMAASMAAVILAGGRKGHRFILPHSRVMIHEPLITNGLGGSATSIKNTSDSILETKSILNGILAKHTKKSIEEIDAATAYDNFMNAEEAVEFGICDKIVKTLS